MALNATKLPSTRKDNPDFIKQEHLAVGGYPCRIVQIIDLGLQAQRPYKGEEKQPQPEIQITYELADEFMLDKDGEEILDKPRWISEQIPFYELKSERAKSTQRYMTLDPEVKLGGDFTKLLKAPCIVNILVNPGKGQHAGKIFNNVLNISAMRPKEMQKAPALVNEPMFFDLDICDMDLFNTLPEWIQEKIKGNLNFNGSALQAKLGGEPTPEEASASTPEADLERLPEDPKPEAAGPDEGDAPW